MGNYNQGHDHCSCYQNKQIFKGNAGLLLHYSFILTILHVYANLLYWSLHMHILCAHARNGVTKVKADSLG